MGAQLRIAIFGNKAETLALLRVLKDAGFDRLSLICLEQNKRMSGYIAGAPRDLEATALALGCQVISVDQYSLVGEDQDRFLTGPGFDIGFTYGWQRLIPELVLQSFQFGVFGWHGSPFEFPNGRGRSPMNWAIRLGGAKVFHYFFQLERGADTGGVVECREIQIQDHDYIGDLYERAHSHVTESSLNLLETVGRGGKISLAKQPHFRSLDLPKLAPKDSAIDARTCSTGQAHRIVRATSHPFDGATVEMAAGYPGESRIIRIWRASARKEVDAHIAGCWYRDGSGNLLLRLIDGSLVVDEFEAQSEFAKKVAQNGMCEIGCESPDGL